MTQIIILTITKFASFKFLLASTSRWPSFELGGGGVLFFLFHSSTKHKNSSIPSTRQMNPRGKVKQGCNGNLVIVPGCINYLLRRGEAVYCHINDYSIFQPARSIFESELALEADCCSHSCDYGHKTTKKKSMWWALWWGDTCVI